MASVSNLLTLSNQLKSISDSPQLDCELLLCQVLGVDRTWLRTWPENQVTLDNQQKYKALIALRLQGKPIAYLTGSRGFWTMDLHVSEDTLIPRPETELLVDLALGINLPKQSLALDLGTGTGAIALALASERSDIHVTAVDSQAGAVTLAKTNCQHYKLTNVVIFQSNWFDAIDAKTSTFDLIVSNPPYIAQQDPHLTQGDVRFEPLSALVSGIDGLDDLRIIVSNSPCFLNPDGWLLLEHGYNQGGAVRDLMAAAGFSSLATHQDYNHQDRVTLGQWK